MLEEHHGTHRPTLIGDRPNSSAEGTAERRRFGRFALGIVRGHHPMVTEALTVLGFDLNAGSEDFEVSPAEMPEVAGFLVLTKAGIQKLNAVISLPSSALPSEP